MPKPLAVAALAASSLALAPPAWSHENYNVFELAWLLDGGVDFDATASGRIDGQDPHLDLLVLVGGNLWMLEDVGEKHFQIRITDTEDITALTLFPGAGPGGSDALLATRTTGGLYKIVWDESLDEFVELSVPCSNGDLSGAQGLSFYELPNGSQVLCGLDDANSLFSGGLVNGTYAEATRFDPGYTVQAWHSLQWDGSSRYEFAVQTSAGLMVFNYQGGQVLPAWLPFSTEVPVLASFHDAALGADRLMWVVDGTTSGTYRVALLDNRFPTYEPPLQLGTVQPGGLAMLDWTAPGSQDLVVAEYGTDDHHVYAENAAASFPSISTFGSWASLGEDLGNGQAGEGQSIEIGDIDLDGDQDVISTVSNFGTSVWRNDRLDARDLMPNWPEVGDFASMHSTAVIDLQGRAVYETGISLQFEAPVSGTADECRVEVYRRLKDDLELLSETPIAVETATFASGGATPLWTQDDSPVAGDWLQVRLTPLCQGVPCGPSRATFFEIYEDPQSVPGNHTHPPLYLVGGIGVSGGIDYPPQPGVGPVILPPPTVGQTP